MKNKWINKCSANSAAKGTKFVKCSNHPKDKQMASIQAKQSSNYTHLYNTNKI